MSQWCFDCFALSRVGGTGIPLHWSLQADTRAVCFRFALEGPNEPGPQWSHPIELEKALNSTARFISLPVRPAAAAAEPEPPLISMEEDGERDEEGLEKIQPAPQKKQGTYLRDITTLQTAAAPPWELHGLQIRVGRRVRHYTRCCLDYLLHPIRFYASFAWIYLPVESYWHLDLTP